MELFLFMVWQHLIISLIKTSFKVASMLYQTWFLKKKKKKKNRAFVLPASAGLERHIGIAVFPVVCCFLFGSTFHML